MYVVIDKTSLFDNHDLISGPFDLRVDAIDHANDLIEWYKKEMFVDSEKIVSDSKRVLGDCSVEYWIWLMDGDSELSRVRVTSVVSPSAYTLT